MSKTDFIRPKFTKITDEERDILIGLRDTVAWDIFRRVAQRYVEMVKDNAFSIPYNDDHFTEKHSDAVGQVFGMQKIINLVEEIKEK